jgi:HAD superfamily hydrolase (TIGR01509 family)
VLASPLPQALVFDLDGTIVDTETPEFESIKAVWADHGLEYTIGHFEHVIGTADASSDWFDELLVAVGRPIDRSVIDGRRREVHRALVDLLAPRDGIVDLIEEAAAAGVPIAVASNSPRWWVAARLQALALHQHIAVMVTLDESTRPKPDPAPFLQACAAVGAAPAMSVAFEDSATGVASARAAGLYTIGCAGPMSRNHDLTAAHRIVGSHVEVTLAELAGSLPA